MHLQIASPLWLAVASKLSLVVDLLREDDMDESPPPALLGLPAFCIKAEFLWLTR